LLADTFDVRGRLHPVDERLEAARGAVVVGAAVHRLALGLDDRRLAERAFFRHPKAFRARRVLARRPDDLGDDVARTLDDDHVAFADLLAVDVLLVVECRA
jgi:hypothetical protein